MPETVAPVAEIESRGYAHPEVLVSTQWVADHLTDPNVRIVESDEDVLLYETGHIPGAVKIDWVADLNDPLGENRCRRLAQRTADPLEAHLRNAVLVRLRLDVHRDDVAAAGIAAGHMGVRVAQPPPVARSLIMVDEPGDARLLIHYGFSTGALTRLPHSVHEPS